MKFILPTLSFVDMAACLNQGQKYIQLEQMRCPFRQMWIPAVQLLMAERCVLSPDDAK